jgi:histidyl-tRNA synthetase
MPAVGPLFAMNTKPQRLNAVKGMNDIFPPESAQWDWFEQQVRDTMSAFAYASIRTPILEHTQLFVKGTGETTDIVEKEMYSFEDRLNGEQLTLRPENTPGVVRAAIEHNLVYDGGKRLYYVGPMFRHERPQRGRYRQFYQVGVEALGFSGAELDAEVIALASQLLAAVGVPGVRVEINSLGVADERQRHRVALIGYFERHRELLDADALRRLHTNPLRILDTKNPQMQQMVQDAPQLLAFLGPASLRRYSVPAPSSGA